MSSLERVVVVGSSLAGLRAAETLRQVGWSGALTLVSDEAEMPYDRPPLSKKLLAGEWEPERIRLRRSDDFEGLRAEWVLGDRAMALDTAHRFVTLASGRRLEFDGLVIATGATVRRLPGQPDWPGVHTLRSLAEAVALRTELEPGRRVAVIGAGFIGLEVAATARSKGCDVTVLEGAEAPMMRGLGSTMGRRAALVHADNGVHIRCGVSVAELTQADDGRVSGVRLSNGEVVPADVVVVGVGVVPSTSWLEGSGLTVRDGVVCDEFLCAGVPGIYAAGDVVRWPHRLLEREVRIEHWTNASEQGAVAAKNLVASFSGDAPTAYAEVPFFWSDQFTSRIQFLGRAEPDDDVEVVVGGPDDRAFVALYHRNGRLTAALGVSRPKQVMPFRRLLSERATIDEARALAASFAI